MGDFENAVAEYGARAKAKLSGPGEREALLSGPVSEFITAVGALSSKKVVAHDEVRELDGTVRPDFGVRVNGLLVGHIELKAPGVSLDPTTYAPNSHNGKQWKKLELLPNLLHTNGIEWRLWRFGELVDEPVHMHTPDLTKTKGTLTAPSRLELILSAFLGWTPTPISSLTKLVDTLAPLAAMLREEVAAALRAEKRAVKAGADRDSQPFIGLAKDWKLMLFPHSTDGEFADRYAQTVVFALVLAISDGTDIATQSLHEVSKQLEGHRHTLMGRALNLLTEHIANSPAGLAVEMITRALGAVDWAKVSAGSSDIYLHLYEHFLGKYDPALRKKSGSYYTPVEVVDGMVRLTDLALSEFFNKPEGLRSPTVSVVDPAMGTGTYPLSVLRRIGDSAAALYGDGATADAVTSAINRLYGIELQSGPFSVAELRVAGAVEKFGAQVPSQGMNLFVADTLEDPDEGSDTRLSYTLQLIAQQRRRANDMKRKTNVQVVIGNPPYMERAGGRGGWIESGIDTNTGVAPLDAFRTEGNGRNEFPLSNLYIYFWRWATWKVFESTAKSADEGDTGIVCFITATGYLTGPGFKGMREYLRRKASHGWIINLTPEGKKPPAKSAVFNIETPVCIGIFARTPDTDEDVPADIRYIEFDGLREEKFENLKALVFDDQRWRSARTGWQTTFTPAAAGNWDSFPALFDLMPWASTGVTPNRNWVIGPSKASLELRLRTLLSENDPQVRDAMFKVTRDRRIDKRSKALPGADVETDTTPLSSVPLIAKPKLVQTMFRSFDRQWVLADNRLMDMARPPLWESRVPGQVFVVEQHSIHPSENDPQVRDAMFKVTRDRRIDKRSKALPGADVETDTTPLSSVPLIAKPKLVQTMFRSFDRQWVLADNRLMDMARPPLWESRVPGQVFVVEQHSIHPGAGPGLHFSALIPDINAFNNRGGRTLPRLHPNGSPNVTPGLDAALKKEIGPSASAADIMFYVAAITGHPAFVEQFADELSTPGIRIPITAEPSLWDTAVRLGKHVVWLTTYGAEGERSEDLGDTAPEELPQYVKSVGSVRPESYEFHSDEGVLTLGSGRWENIAPEVFGYTVGNVAVVQSWLKYRMAKPTGKVSSPLDELHDPNWAPEWSIELTELLRVLTNLVAMEGDLDQLLGDVLAGPLVSMEQLVAAGMRTGLDADDRKPKRTPYTVGMFAETNEP